MDFSKITSGLNKVAMDPVAMQYLLAGGSDLLAGQPFGQNINATTLNLLGAMSQKDLSEKKKQPNQELIDLITSMLEGEIPEGGSILAKPDGYTFKVPSSPSSELGKELFSGAFGAAGPGASAGMERIGFNPFR